MSPGNGLPLCRTVCVHPPHLLSAICISHLGPVPLGKFPTPVHLSLRGWSSCRASSCEGQHGLLQQRAGTKDSVSFLLPAPPEAAPSSGPGQGRAGWGPGTRTGTGTGSISLVRAACCVLSQLVLLLKQREQKEKFYSHHKDFIFGGFFVRAFLCLSEVLLCSCKTEIQRIIKTTRKLNHRNVRKQYRAQRKKQIVFHTHKFPLGLTASQEYFQGIGRKKLN